MAAKKAVSSLETAREVLATEARAIEALIDRLGPEFDQAVEMLLDCAGRVVVTGMGKSGLIGKKIAATLSSTGTPAVFLHPAEAVHGDLGMVVSGDVVLALSNSGETAELVRLLEWIRRTGAHLLALCGAPASTLAQHADIVLSVEISIEACPLDLAPTASTTAQLALGDALAMSVMRRRNFTAEDFATRHPGGELGRKLVPVDRLMHKGDAIPTVKPDATLEHVVKVMTSKGLGAALVVEEDNRLVGIVTDGDLRRLVQQQQRPHESRAGEFMSPDPATIAPSELAVAALSVMENRLITSLAVVDDRHRLVGFLHLHDLWRTQMF
jgi:arabinose-5-phosphate isomerase